jgi:hypothetical protein
MAVVVREWVSVLLFFHVVLLIVVAIAKLLRPRAAGKVNAAIRKDDPKVVDLVDVEDLSADKVSYCRCWKSKKVRRHSCVFSNIVAGNL